MVREYYKFIKDYLTLAELKFRYVLINFISAILYKGLSLLLPFVGSIIIKYLTLNDVRMTYISLGIYLTVYIFYILSLYLNYHIYGFNMNYCYDHMTTKVLKKLVSVDDNFTRIISKGRLMNSINSDIVEIGDMCDQIAEFFVGIIQIIAVFIIIGTINIYLSFIFVIFSFFYLTIRNRADRKVNYFHNKVKIQEDHYTNLLTQMVSGLQEIKTFNMLDKLKSKLFIIQKKFSKFYGIKRKHYAIRDNDVKGITYVFRFVLYLVLIYLVFTEKIDVSVLVLVISYHEYLVTYINWLIESSSAIRETNTAVNRVNDILNYNSEDIIFGEIDTKDIYGVIEFKNVSLTLKNKEVLHNINLKVDHSEVIAIVGETGSGKTMILNLLLRLYEPTKGRIKLDNTDIFEFSKKSYSNLVSVVTQKPFIFNMSIRKNLNFVDKNISNQIEACKKAGIHDFIETLPNGYNTILRENGSNISGGQKQMISIARTILTDAEILLLDDITTSLDPDTAKLVPDLIKKLRQDHTIIMVTKKPDLMSVADRIVVLEKGKINAVGTHKELLKSNQIYQMLQSRKSPSKIGVFDND